MDVGRYLPSERLVQQVILRGGAEILRAAHDMGDAHGMVVDDVGKVVGRIAVLLDQDLILQLRIVHGDLAENRVGEGGGAFDRHFLADDIGRAGVEKLLDFLPGQIAAVAVIAAAGILALNGFQTLLGAEAAVCLALIDELFGKGEIHLSAFALDIGAVVAADIGTLVMLKSRGGEGFVDDVHSALDIALLIGVLNAEHKGASLRFCNQIFIQRRSEIADVHKAGRRRRKTGSYLAHCV